MRILLTTTFIAFSLIASAQRKSILGKYSHSGYAYEYILTLTDHGKFVIEDHSHVRSITTTGTWKIRRRLITLTPTIGIMRFPKEEAERRKHEIPLKRLEKSYISVDKENNLTILSQEKKFDTTTYTEPAYGLTKIYSGLVKTNLPEEMAKAFAGQPKIVKRQFTGEGGNVHCGLQDKKGNLWFATEGEGVYRHNGKSFTNFTEKDGLNSTFIFSMVEDKKGNIWFATDFGVCRFDGKTFIPFSPTAKKIVASILADKSGKLWFGASDGVYCYDGKAYTRFLDNQGIINSNGLALDEARFMLEDKHGNIWFTTRNEGVCQYDGKSIVNYKPNEELSFRGLLEDKNGDIWVSRRGKGVCRYDGKIFRNLSLDRRFDSLTVNSITQDKSGNIWFGTEADDRTEGGVWVYDGVSFKNFSEKDGLNHNAVCFVLEDKSGNFWIGTRNTGLCRYDGKTFTSFSK